MKALAGFQQTKKNKKKGKKSYHNIVVVGLQPINNQRLHSQVESLVTKHKLRDAAEQAVAIPSNIMGYPQLYKERNINTYSQICGMSYIIWVP